MRIISAVILFVVGMALPARVLAAPYFTLEGSSALYPGDNFAYFVRLNTDSQQLTSAQTVITFDDSVVNGVAIDARNTACSFWAPADPSLEFGNDGTPYFYQNKLVMSCGFSNPGYTSSENDDPLLTFFMTPDSTASSSGTAKTSTLSFSDTLFYYAENAIATGASQGMSITAYPTALAATPTPTIPSANILSEDDLNFIEIGTTTGIGTSGTGTQALTTNQQGALNAIARDDTIPPPPDDLEPRSPVTPYPLAPFSASEEEDDGEVLSVKSLREILIPGKSEADKSVVFINLISTLAFLVILAILIWRLILVNRKNKFKYAYMKDMITGELSVLESKMDDSEEIEKGYKDQLEQLKRELQSV